MILCKHCNKEIVPCYTGECNYNGYIHKENRDHNCVTGDYKGNHATDANNENFKYFSDGSPVEIYENIK